MKKPSKKELIAALRKLEEKMSDIDSRMRDAMHEAAVPFEAEKSEAREQMADVRALLALFAPVAVGDVIFNKKHYSRSKNRMMRVTSVDGVKRFDAVMLKVNGEEGELYENFYMYDDGRTDYCDWELVRRAGDPVPQAEVTEQKVRGILRAAKLSASTNDRMLGRGEGFYFSYEAKSLLLHYSPSRYERDNDRKKLQEDLALSQYQLVLMKAGIKCEATKYTRKNGFGGDYTNNVIVIPRWPEQEIVNVA